MAEPTSGSGSNGANGSGGVRPRVQIPGAFTASGQDLVYDWNAVERTAPLSRRSFKFFDETLRDGIQSPSVHDPSIDDKLEFVRLSAAIGIDAIDVGLPGAGARAFEDVVRIVEMIRDEKLPLQVACAARTHVNDIRPIVEASQRTGVAIEVMAFIGSSPIRLYAEDWTLDLMLKRSAEAIDLGVASGLPVTYVTEDTTRSRPEMLHRLFENAIAHGATRLCLCDTVGHVTPDGIRNLITWTRNFIAGLGVEIGVDWHGHNDRGIAVTNTIHALEYGADRLHGTALGVGERVGNAALDQVMVNLKLLGEIPDRDVSRLADWVRLASRATQVPIPYNYPVFGQDAFRTATGVHAAAIIKAEKKGDAELADRVYSGVPASLFGRHQEIEIGPMSGESNVVYWLTRRGIDPEPTLVKALFAFAKQQDHLLTEEEIRGVITIHRGSESGGSVVPLHTGTSGS